MKSGILHIDPKLLLPYREFDRVSNPAPKIAFFQMYNVDDCVDYFRDKEMTELELTIYDGTACLTDGNHRLAAALILGLQSVPVRVNFVDCNRELVSTFYRRTRKKFVKIGVELNLSLLFCRLLFVSKIKNDTNEFKKVLCKYDPLNRNDEEEFVGTLQECMFHLSDINFDDSF